MPVGLLGGGNERIVTYFPAAPAGVRTGVPEKGEGLRGEEHFYKSKVCDVLKKNYSPLAFFILCATSCVLCH